MPLRTPRRILGHFRHDGPGDRAVVERVLGLADDLIGLVALAGDHQQIAVAELADRTPDPAGALTAVLVSLLDERRADVTLIWVQSWSLGGRNDVLARCVREQMDAWRVFLAGVIERGRAGGALRCDDPLTVAGQILGMVDGLNAHSLVAWQDATERTRLLLRSVEAMLDLAPGALVERLDA